MAGLRFRITSGSISLLAATTKTALRMKAGANNPVRLVQWGCTFKGTSTTAAPGLVRLKRESTDGTATSQTPVKTDDRVAGTIQAAGTINFTAEPTIGDILEEVN